MKWLYKSYLSMVHEVENGLELSFLDAFQVEEWVLPVGVVGQDPPEEGRARGQYHFVGSDLQGHRFGSKITLLFGVLT